MRKLLVALMLVAFAATAFADVTLSGTYKARGNYMDNLQTPLVDSDDDNAMFYDHDLDIWLKAQTDKDTYFQMKVEMLDGQWKERTDDGINATKTGDEIQVERAWLGHNFGVAKLDVGMMTGGAWSYVFGNTEDAFYRVKATVPAGPGKVIAFVQKNAENSLYSNDKDAEKDDSDTYFVGFSGKFGGITVQPGLSYIMDGNAEYGDEEVDTKKTKFDIGVGGAFGAVGFESEFIYLNVDPEGDSYSTYGIYANVYSKVAGATVGFITAYSSVDDDTQNAFHMGEDFDDMYFLVLGDYEAYGTGLEGLWGNVLYADYAVNDKLNVYGSVAYAMSNYDEGALEDATAYEIDLGLGYKITDALSYGVDFGYAQMDIDNVDTDAHLLLQHYLKISF